MWRALFYAALIAVPASDPRPTPSAPLEVCHAAIGIGTAPGDSDDVTSAQPRLDVRWRVPDAPKHRDSLTPWCAAVGPAVVIEGTHSATLPTDRLIVASWNMHVGGGDLAALLGALGVHAASDGSRPGFVLLLQEVFRSGAAVPTLSSGARVAKRINQQPPSGERTDIVQQARDLGLWAVYVPSMRNGGEADEDRGNAILSSLPLDGVEAIELPSGHQRRVAVAADVSGITSAKESWRLRVASVHLESQAGARHLWIFASGVRAAQVRAAVSALDDARALVLGGDFNSWSGFDEPAVRETKPRFPETYVTDRRPTFAWGLRLDHLFFRLPSGWQARFARLDERFGSDHYPLAGTIDLTSAQADGAATRVR